MLNIDKGQHLQLRCHPPLNHNFKWFNIKAATAYYLIIQKQVNELLARGVIEPFNGGDGFYINVFMVHKYICGL